MSTRFQGLLRLTFEGPLLVGGHSPRHSDLDAATARDEQDNPIVPATALKGALREAAVLILHARHPGAVPASWDSRADLDADARAQAERLDALFGPPGAGGNHLLSGKESPGQSPGLRVADARPVGTKGVGLGTRHGVSIDRFTGARSRGRLFRREVAEAAGSVFEAPVHGTLTPEAVALLHDAAALVENIGSSASRGGGRVSITLVEVPTRKETTLQIAGGIQEGAARVEITLVEPMHCGGPADGGNTRETLRFVPGSALRGALVAAAQRAGIAADALWADTFIASDLLPIGKGGGMPRSNPRTAMIERNTREGTPKDRILEEAIVRALAERGIGSRRVDGPIFDNAPPVPVQTRLVTRLARDPALRSAAPGQLHVREQIVPGKSGHEQKFVGHLAGVSGAALNALRALADAREPITIGALRHRGLGRVSVHIGPAPEDNVKSRLSRFQSHAKALLSGLGALLPWKAEHLVQIVARTPIHSGDIDTELRALFPGAEVTLRGRFCRDEARGGWDDRQGKPLALATVFAPGSTWLLEVSGGVQKAHLAKLQEAHARGIGIWREHGLGRIDVCPLFI